MLITNNLLSELQNRLKVGNRRGVHLNAIPNRSRFKFDLNRLSHLEKNLPQNFINSLLSEKPLKFDVSWKKNVPDINSLFEEEQTKIVNISKSFENLISETVAIEAEKGINTFGFGFPLLIRRDQSDNSLTVSPILIWSLRIKRTKEFNTWVIERDEEDPIYLNEVLVNHIQSDANFQLDQIPQDYLEDGLITPEELVNICCSLIQSINTDSNDNLSVDFHNKLMNVKSIKDKKHYENLPITSSNALVDFAGLFSIFEVQKQNIINDYDFLLEGEKNELDIESKDNFSFQPISSVETDPSQQGILHALQTNRNILIQGPPGTGKSQSLTAILVNALENHKKTIVVCEKRTALEVLQNALVDKGLGDHCVLVKDIIKDRRPVVDSVRNRVEDKNELEGSKFSKNRLNIIINRANDLINTINKKHQKLAKELIGGKNWTDTVGQWMSKGKLAVKDENLEIDADDFKYTNDELSYFIELIERGQRYYKEYNSIEEELFIKSEKFIGENQFSIEQQMQQDFKFYKKSLNTYNELLAQFKEEYKKTREESIKVAQKEVIDLIKSLENILTQFNKESDFYEEARTSSILFSAKKLFSKEAKRIVSAQTEFKSLFTLLNSRVSYFRDEELITIIPKVSNALEIEPGLSIDILVDVFEKYQVSNKNKDINIEDFVEKEFEINCDNLNFSKNFRTQNYDNIKAAKNNLIAKVEEDNWLKQSFKQGAINFNGYVSNAIFSYETYIDSSTDLFSAEYEWHNYVNQLKSFEKELIGTLKEHEKWSNTFLVFYLNSLLNKGSSASLPTHDKDHKELEVSMNNLEIEQLKYIKDYWRSEQNRVSRLFDENNPNLSITNLYNKKSSQRHKRLSLRRISKFDLDFFTTFFPIILTTPDVCSNLFKGKKEFFDIVMFDEASQLRVEDNLPALLKGKQIIIAGDEHQMPPSNYFSKMFDGTIEDQEDQEEEDEIIVDRDNLLLSCESLLEFASEFSFQKKYLDFHYRSKHPYLIDFSNYAFYNQRLKPLPNNLDYNPIKYINVGGTFSDHSNDTEAEYILSILDKNIQRFPNGKYPTVGIATFNIAQRNLIYSKINDRKQIEKFKDFNSKIVELEENGLFIKNLENIQGDERDIIILSTTYGKNKDGRFFKRFGPLGFKKGYKLLNVIITRAKYKIYVCSSIPEEHIVGYNQYLINEGSNNRSAVFFAYLAYAKAVSEKNEQQRMAVLNSLAQNTTESQEIVINNGELESPFEEEVYQVLIENFKEEDIFPQFKFAGFRIDIVIDSKIKGIPRIAIECDGAAYHSSREAYLNDRHRQKILESHGFVFHRIWSTNWWRNQNREIKTLVHFIKTTLESTPKAIEDNSRTVFAFNDEEFSLRKLVDSQTDLLQELNESPIVEDTKDKPEIRSNNVPTKKVVQKIEEDLNLFSVHKDEEVVQINSIVKIKYLNNNMFVKIKIVASENNKGKLVNGIQKVSFKSSVAVSLMGKPVGKTVKVGRLDNYVEIIEITNL
tara:strand:+ start:10343 stop:14821 length:4479 start_codon:yes stop_codon:yes gene_type:complete